MLISILIKFEKSSRSARFNKKLKFKCVVCTSIYIFYNRYKDFMQNKIISAISYIALLLPGLLCVIYLDYCPELWYSKILCWLGLYLLAYAFVVICVMILILLIYATCLITASIVLPDILCIKKNENRTQ